MEIRKLKLEGTFEIRPKIIGDMRGYFAETYRSDDFERHGLQTVWIQENQSLSTRKNTIRGLHYQKPPFAQIKLIRTPIGSILDVFVDIRKNSKTYGKWDSIIISDELCNLVYIPKGFAHGFCTLTENTVVQYKVDNYYSRENESGILWNDTKLAIDWKTNEPYLSERDLTLPTFAELITPFV